MNLLGLKAALTLDTDDYERGLGKAEKRAGIFAEVLKANLVTKGAEVAIKGLARLTDAATKLVGDIVNSYADYEQLAGGVETLFKDSADKVKNYADRAFQTAGLSANEYMETVSSFSASLIQSLGGDTAKAADMADMAITDMADNANKMGTDMSSIQTAYAGFAKQNYTMLDNLKLGYGGTKTEMDRLIKDAAKLDKSFRATEKTVTKNGKSTKELAYSYADVVKAIHIVQTNMGITGTTAKEATQTIQGSMNALKAAWKNLLTGIGSGNQADLDRLIGQVVAAAHTAMQNVLPVVKSGLQGLGQLVKGIAPDLGRELPGIAIDLLPYGLDALGGFMEGLFAAVPGFVSKGLPFVIRGISDTINGIIRALPQLGARLYNYMRNELLPDIAWAIAEATGGGWEEANSLYHGMTGVLDYLAQGFDTVTDAAGRLFDSVGKLIMKIVDLGYKFLWVGDDEHGGMLKQFFEKVLPGALEIAGQDFDDFIDILDALAEGDWATVLDKFNSIFERTFGGIGEALRVLFEEPIIDASNNVIRWINSLIDKAEAGINTIISGLNKIPFTNLGTVRLGRLGEIGVQRTGGAGRRDLLADRMMAAGGILGEGQSAVVGEYAPERLRVVNGRAVVTPTGWPRFPQPQAAPPRPVQIVFEVDGAKRWVYNATQDEKQRVGVVLSN